MNLYVTNRLWPLALLAIFCVSCNTTGPMPALDLSAPGWHVQQGQAVWKPERSRPELAGDLLLATNDNGNYFVQFSKTPFTLAIAEVSDPNWRIDFGSGQHVWSGQGKPPQRFGWFHLSHFLAGVPPLPPWRFSVTNGTWRMENNRTGETLEGGFSP